MRRPPDPQWPAGSRFVASAIVGARLLVAYAQLGCNIGDRRRRVVGGVTLVELRLPGTASS